MYNQITEEKIKQIPQIGDIDIERLPQELTRIYAQIVTIRRQIADGTISFQTGEFRSSLNVLQALANNLETILLTFPQHERKESIAFVAATAHSLIHKIGLAEIDRIGSILEVDTISSFISAILLFLIGNSQADAAEMTIHLPKVDNSSLTKQKLVFYIKELAKGSLSNIYRNPFVEEDINTNDRLEASIDYLYRELGLGIENIASILTGRADRDQTGIFFDRVIDLSVSEDEFFYQKNVFSGPYHLAKLLRILEGDILERGVINIPTPQGLDFFKWSEFLQTLAHERPYLWENHIQAVHTNFLNPGISAVLTLPTGAGKSTLSELKIASCLISERKVIYLVPTHALEDQVNKNLSKIFHEYSPNQDELDGEYTEKNDISSLFILVMTPERCLALLNTDSEFFQRVGLIVFDEFHLIHGTDINKDRRSIDAMYCLISLFALLPQADYLLISAMVENGDEIKEWIEEITKRHCELFNSSWKPTRQLHGCLVFEEKEISALKREILSERSKTKAKGPSGKLQKKMGLSPHCFFSLRNIWETKDNSDYFRTQILDENVLLSVSPTWRLTSNRNDIAARLAVHFCNMGLKTLVFVDDPRIAKSTSQKIMLGLQDRKNNYIKYQRANADQLDILKKELGNIEHSYFHDFENVGIHHGLLLPIERTLIEQYFKSPNGSIALVATATLAQGINLPAEIVIIAGDDRFDEDLGARLAVLPHELLNAAGRAGRAGQSSQGAVILIPGDIVTIENSTISQRWWTLKEKVFSKSDQCLIIEDPLQFFLDSIQDESENLSIIQTNILYKFKSENLSDTETRQLLAKSFFAFKAAKANEQDSFGGQVNRLITRRNQLDDLSENVVWTKEISFKTGVDPNLILELGNEIGKENIQEFLNLTVIQLITWYFNWLQKDKSYLHRVFTKDSTISQIKKAIGIHTDVTEISSILENLSSLRDLLIQYVQGVSLNKINDSIPNSKMPDKSPYLVKARNFVIRLVPELSFSFGLLSMIVIEKAKQQGVALNIIPWTIKALANCIREGFDDVEKVFYKKNNNLLMRVDTHLKHYNDIT